METIIIFGLNVGTISFPNIFPNRISQRVVTIMGRASFDLSVSVPTGH